MRYQEIMEDVEPISLQDWWKSGKGRNQWTVYSVPTGSVSVYARRNIVDPRVIEIVSISTIDGFGAARSLYRTFLADIPAIAENVLNSDLDRMLEKLGWDFAYRDLADIPTRINKKFQETFPDYAQAHSAFAAILTAKKSS